MRNMSCTTYFRPFHLYVRSWLWWTWLCIGRGCCVDRGEVLTMEDKCKLWAIHQEDWYLPKWMILTSFPNKSFFATEKKNQSRMRIMPLTSPIQKTSFAHGRYFRLICTHTTFLVIRFERVGTSLRLDTPTMPYQLTINKRYVQFNPDLTGYHLIQRLVEMDSWPWGSLVLVSLCNLSN